MKTVKDFEIVQHGIECSDYFQGCGVAFTEFEDVATGTGSTEGEAFDQALDYLAQNDWNVDSIELSDEARELDQEETPESEEAYWYISVRVK